jgi:hypothetical protein
MAVGVICRVMLFILRCLFLTAFDQISDIVLPFKLKLPVLFAFLPQGRGKGATVETIRTYNGA